MKHSIAHLALVVRDYDEAIASPVASRQSPAVVYRPPPLHDGVDTSACTNSFTYIPAAA